MMIRNHYCYCFSSIISIYFSFLIYSTLASPRLHFCRHDQRDALLEFMHEFPTAESFPRSWNKSSDCCSWDGVLCDDKSGQVISLDLSTKSLNGSMKTNSSLFKLQYLRDLRLNSCNLQGKIPSSVGNLSRLENLFLTSNHLVGEVPASIGNLTELEIMSLEINSLSGSFPSSLANLTKLTRIFLNSNNFTSMFSSDMSGLHNLEWFDISENSFFGHFPKSLFTISSLIIVSFEKNQFTGPIDFENTSSPLLFKLEDLVLASNKFDGPIPESISKFINLRHLDLSRNNLSGPIPRSISKLVNLRHLDFAKNKLEGEVPACLWDFPTVMISHNYFSSFENVSEERTDIHRVDLNSNSFRGPFPHWVCKFYWLEHLDLSNNHFSGSIPPCLRNFTFYLMELSLGNNNFSGTLPDIFADATRLESLDVSRNRLEGKFPKSLIHCKALQHVNVGSNKFKDKFPHWLGSLPSLHVLSLRCNKFFGPLYLRRHHRHMFKSLRVIDISHNDFTGTLPSHYFSSWHGINNLTEEYNQYMESHSFFDAYFDSYPFVPENYESVEMVIKGVEMSFERIRQDFRAIDFSGNRIHGKIPESLCSLKELRVLNLSGNAFTGVIPRSFAKLTKLETLDLSCNKLSGEIPQDLGNLSFLSYMNFSHNHLQGSVPRGTQFQSQNCSSFTDNPGLLGLEEICRKPDVLDPPTSHQENEDLSESEEPMFNWVAAAIAYGPGVFCGFVIGYIFTSGYREWFAEKLGRRKLRVTRSTDR